MEFHSRLQADKSASTHAIWIPGTVTKPPWHAAPRYQWGGVWKTMWTPIDFPSPLSITTYWHMAVCQNLVPLVNIKIAGKWMFIPLKKVLIGIDPYPYFAIDDIGYAFRLCRTHLNWMHPSLSLSDSLHLYVGLFWTPPILRQTSIPCSRSNNSHPSGSINVLGNFRSGYPRCVRVATMSVAWPG